ncbi:unnamed protein product, partial [Discosporangium mesarthrocarpum]
AGAGAGGYVSDTEKGFLILCEELLLLLRTVASCEEGAKTKAKDDRGRPHGREGHLNSTSSSLWGNLRSLGYEVLDTLESLFSVPSFVAVTQELLRHEDAHLRRKALEMFTKRLGLGTDPACNPGVGGGGAALTPEEEQLFLEMLPDMESVAAGRGGGE